MRALIDRLSIRTRAGLLSFVLPGLGHVYLGRFARALIWFAGLMVLTGVAGGDAADPWVAPVLGTVLAVCSSADAMLVTAGSPRQRAR